MVTVAVWPLLNSGEPNGVFILPETDIIDKLGLCNVTGNTAPQLSIETRSFQDQMRLFIR